MYISFHLFLKGDRSGAVFRADLWGPQLRGKRRDSESYREEARKCAPSGSWTGLDRNGREWTRPDRIRPDWTGLDQARPDRTGADQNGPDRAGLDQNEPDRTGLDWPDWTRPGHISVPTGSKMLSMGPFESSWQDVEFQHAVLLNLAGLSMRAKHLVFCNLLG